jgi:hypothetical protein
LEDISKRFYDLRYQENIFNITIKNCSIVQQAKNNFLQKMDKFLLKPSCVKSHEVRRVCANASDSRIDRFFQATLMPVLPAHVK